MQCVGLDVQAPAALGRRLQQTVAIQGALDPVLLRIGGPALDARVETLLEQWSAGRYVFNLGHGVFPDTPIENIERVVKRVTGSSFEIAVVLFNLGGPDGPAAVKPFLYNLFSDPAIIGAPALLRKPLAAFIASTREKLAIANYAMMGGGSPIVVQTIEQAEALESTLKARRPSDEIKVFIAMRYWAPRAREVAKAVRAYAPDDVVLAPLYPHYSTTTTASSIAEWRRYYDGPCRGSAAASSTRG